MSTHDQFGEDIIRRRDDPALPADQVPVPRRHHTLSGGGFVGRGPRQPMSPLGRICAYVEDDQRCTTILSVYNPADRCSLHAGFGVRSHDQAPSR